MMFTNAAFTAAIFGLAANAHLFMSSPSPIAGTAIKDPLDESGNNFPCHGVALPGSGGQSMPVGSSQLLQWQAGAYFNETAGGPNTAVHGGGSCQLSITYETDADKVKDPSNWKVIYSIEEGCPTNSLANLDGQNFTGPAGNYTDTFQCTDDVTNGFDCLNQFNFTIPEGVKNGQATLAWTWFNTIGNREMYMNCAAIDITGGSDDDSGMSDLPSMFVANLASINTCASVEGQNLKFPEPGKHVTTHTATTKFAVSSATSSYPLAGPTSCGTAASSDSGFSASAAVSSYAATSSAAPSLTLSVEQNGVTSVDSVDSQTSTVYSTTLLTKTGTEPSAPAAATSVIGTAANAYLASALPTAVSTGTGSSAGNGTCETGKVSCPTPGAIICLDDSQFGLCNIDYCASPEALADGTTCTSGVISKRDVIRRRGSRIHRHVPGHVHMNSF